MEFLPFPLQVFAISVLRSGHLAVGREEKGVRAITTIVSRQFLTYVA